jgi:cleavage stimulation factor subunit 2
VGNIPYDATDQQLIEIFNRVGNVVNFRLVHDRDTGRPKGYGFCEFRDPETAQSAIRNLNNYDFHGRPLRVDYADDDKSFPNSGKDRDRDRSGGDGDRSERSSRSERRERRESESGKGSSEGSGSEFGFSQPKNFRPTSSTTIGSHTPVETPLNPIELITKLVKSMTRAQLIEVLSEMKRFVVQNPKAARQFLVETPQLAQSILQFRCYLVWSALKTFNPYNYSNLLNPLLPNHLDLYFPSLLKLLTLDLLQ